ncbi:MAG: Hsp70 family protein [Hyphomonadaceae bacterium]
MRVGIDFGTSNTSVAFRAGNEINLAPLEASSTSIPTAIFYDALTRDTLLGNSAVTAYEEGEDGRLMRSIKSLLGTALIDESTQVGNRRVSFKAIVTQFLWGILNQIERSTGEKVTSVTQGRPVSFNDTDPVRDAKAQDILQDCLNQAGVADVTFLEEPVAAAKSVTFSPERENLAIVIDIGGGTSDFSVIRVSKNNNVFEVLSSAGVYVGGNELDRLLSFHDIAKLFGKDETFEKTRLPTPNEPYAVLSDWKLLHKMYARDMAAKVKWMRTQSPNSDGIAALQYLIARQDAHRYANKIEDIKVGLSQHKSALFQYPMNSSTLEKHVHRSEFELLIDAPLAKMEQALDECLIAADVADAQLTDIILVGGSTLVPAVERRLTRRFEQANIVSNDRFSSVAKGLAAHLP